MWNPWLALSAQAALLGWEAQRVIALRLIRIAAGGARGRDEAQRMMTEKLAAAVEAQAAVAASAIEGGSSHRAGKKMLGRLWQARPRQSAAAVAVEHDPEKWRRFSEDHAPAK